MPAPLAKGIIITVSVLVAAGIAVYESPKVRRWINNYRRRLANTLYDMGDGIHPRDSSPQDISMVEEIGEQAEERRRRAREDIMRRASLIEILREKEPISTATSFETLVDKEGHLKQDHLTDIESSAAESTVAKSTALDPSLQTIPDGLTERRLRTQDELLRAIDRDRLHASSEIVSNHPSESLVDLTPTSEFPDTDAAASSLHRSRQHQLVQSEYFSVTSEGSSDHTDVASDFYYAHPDYTAGREHPHPLIDRPEIDLSSTSSIPGSLSHIQNITPDASSDGTLSDLGHPGDGIATPASWSEVGSIISSDDGHHL